jgi:prepilin-type N-terminal cleavage/methylation domain-containing protein
MIISHWYARHRGFTLAEAMLAIVVLGIAAAGVLLPFSSGAAVQAEGMRRTLGAKLAGDLMEQITTLPFHDPDGSAYYYNEGPDAGEATLEDFDNIDDFDGYTELQGQVKDSSGMVFTDLNYIKFDRDASCNYVYVPQESQLHTPEYILITVRVYYDGREIAAINRLVNK